MRFAYYQGLSRAEQRAYDDSDRRRTVPLSNPLACKAALADIEQALAADDRAATEKASRALVEHLVTQLSAPPVVVLVLAVRPSDDDGELQGFYEMDDDGCQIKVWMRTAARRKPVAFRSFVRTVLHELVHHLDFARDELEHSFHTHGFFARENDLARQLLGAPPARVPKVQESPQPKFLDAKLRQAELFPALQRSPR